MINTTGNPLCPCYLTRLRLPIKSFWRSDSESWTFCLSLFGSVVVGIKSNMFDILHDCNLSTFTLAKNSPVSGFLRSNQNQIYTILCCLGRPVTLSPRRPGLSSRPQQKTPIAVLGNLLLVPGGLRKLQTSLRPSQYISNRIRVETDNKHSLITSQLGNQYDFSEDV